MKILDACSFNVCAYETVYSRALFKKKKTMFRKKKSKTNNETIFVKFIRSTSISGNPHTTHTRRT